MTNSNDAIVPNVRTTGFIVLLLTVILIWSVSWVLGILLISSWEDRGNFGDMFGAVNALFSGAALAGVVYAILLQRRDLELQRLELKLTRDELHRAAAAQENSERSLAKQAESLSRSARLSAMSTLLGAYTKNLEWFDEDEAARQKSLAQHGGIIAPSPNVKIAEQTLRKYRNILIELEALARERE